MIEKYFKKTSQYFSLRNYKYETVFHIAARHDAVDALKAVTGKCVFLT